MEYPICEYCGMKIKTKNPKKKTHALCDELSKISGGRNLTYANADSYPMSYISEPYRKKFDNLKCNSDYYTYTHQVVAQILIGRKLKFQSDGIDVAEIVDHIRGSKSKKNFAPYNLRVMKLQDHVHSHKFHKGKDRKWN